MSDYTFVYNKKRYPFIFDIFKYSSELPQDKLNEIKMRKIVNIVDREDENNVYLSDDSIITFIKSCQRERKELNNQNVFGVRYLAQIYCNPELTKETEEYIKKTNLKSELLHLFGLNFNDLKTKEYEDAIACDIFNYIDEDIMFSFKVPIIHRILTRYLKNNNTRTPDQRIMDFIFKYIDIHGIRASALFTEIDFLKMPIENLHRIMELIPSKIDPVFLNGGMLKSIYETQKKNEAYLLEMRVQMEKNVKECVNNTVSKLMNDEISKIKNDVNKNKEDIAKIQQDLKQMGKNIASNKDCIEKNNKNDLDKMKQLEQSLTKNQSNIEQIQKQIGKNSTDIQQIQKSITQINTNIEQAQKSISQNNTNIQQVQKTLTQKIEDIQKSHQNHSNSEITQMKNELKQIRESINKKNDVEKKIEELQNLINMRFNVEKFKYSKEINNIEKKNNDKIDKIKDNVSTLFRCITSASIPNSMTIIPDNFFEKSNIVDIKIHSNVTEIGKNAFSECDSLVKLIIPSSVKLIKQDAFYGCTSLTSITISSSLTIIESWTFANCKSLKQIEIPSSVTKIEPHAFSYCTSLNQITFRGNTTIQNDAFEGCTSLTRVNTKQYISQSAFPSNPTITYI